MAAALGLPFAFASHFAPDMLDEALHIYRSHFKPSPVLSAPYAMAAFNIIAAPTGAEAAYLASSMQQSFVSLRTGNPRQMPAPVEGYYESLAPQLQGMLDHVLSCSAIGAPESVETALTAFRDRTKADEIIVACSIFDHVMRKRSLTMAADILAKL